MAKFKKKRSAATPGSDDLKKKKSLSTKEDDDKTTIPDVEGGGANDASKPEESVGDDKGGGGGAAVSQAQLSERNRKLNNLFWFRVVLAVIIGSSAAFIFEDIEGEERRWASIGLMIIVFMGTIVVAKNMNLQLPPSDRKKVVTQAIGSYVFLYLFCWIVTYTLTNAEEVTRFINI